MRVKAVSMFTSLALNSSFPNTIWKMFYKRIYTKKYDNDENITFMSMATISIAPTPLEKKAINHTYQWYLKILWCTINMYIYNNNIYNNSYKYIYVVTVTWK